MKRLFTFTLLIFATLSLSAAEQEVMIDCPWGKLCGTLLSPEKGSETVALFIAGSGPTDRNGNSKLGLTTNSFIYLAEGLEQSGIASLRYDKRGVGASHLDLLKAMENGVFEDYINDATAAVNYLKAQGFKKIFLIGHSEGSLIALCVARHTPAVTGVVSLAGAGYTLDEIIQLQLAAQLATTDLSLLLTATSILHSLKQGILVKEYPPVLAGLFNPSVQPFLISQLKYNPQQVIRAVTCPVLIINGDNDLQISVDNANALKTAKPQAELLIIKEMTHVLKSSDQRDLQGQLLGVYMNTSQHLSDPLIPAITRFIHSL
ncbi:MAG: alpha/beta fold hydrolase [Alistipes sp.]